MPKPLREHLMDSRAFGWLGSESPLQAVGSLLTKGKPSPHTGRPGETRVPRNSAGWCHVRMWFFPTLGSVTSGCGEPETGPGGSIYAAGISKHCY